MIVGLTLTACGSGPSASPGGGSGLVQFVDPPDEPKVGSVPDGAANAAPPEESAPPLELEVVLRDEAQKVVVTKPPPRKSGRETTVGPKHKPSEGDDLLGGDEDGDAPPPPPPPPPPPGSVELAASTERLGSSVQPEAVRDVIEQSRAIFRMCSEADASVALDVTISPSGEVGDVSSSASEPDDVRLRDCVVSAFRKLRFPPIASTESARVKLRLALRRD